MAVTVGYWLARNDAKIDFFLGAGGGASTIHTPPTSTRAQGVSGGVVGIEGGGSLVGAGRVTALFLGEGTRRVTMEIAPWCGAIYCILDGVA